MRATRGKLNPIPHVIDKINRDKKIIVGYYIIDDFTYWGMVPCIFHLILRRRPIIKTCDCLATDWSWDKTALNDLILKHKHLVARHLWRKY